MVRKGRTIVALIFAATTLVSTLVIGYSLIYYVDLSLAMRTVSAYVKDFEVEIAGENHIMISTNVVVNNTTPFQFTWLWIEENVYVNQTRVALKYEVFPENRPRMIPSYAETSYVVEIDLYLTSVKPEIAEWLSDPSMMKIWLAGVDIYCDTPLTGTTKLSTSATIEAY
jgi:hypothetical protein